MERLNQYLVLITVFFLCSDFILSQSVSLNLHGQYLGQKAPVNDAEIFAPGIVNTGIPARDIAITPDGKEIYFTLHGSTYLFSTILFTKYENGKWTKPEVTSFTADPRFGYTEPCISPDGKQFYFVSNRPLNLHNGTKKDYDVWVMERTGDKWSEPQNLGAPVNSEADEYFPSLTNEGTFYFTREGTDRTNAIYRCKNVNGKYSEPEKLPAQVNSGADRYNAFISPDESYIIVSVYRAKDGKGATDYYIVFRNADDTWQDPINMGEKVNSAYNEYSPYVTRDGKYFFFMSMKPDENLFSTDNKFTAERLNRIHNSAGNGNNTIYWIDASFINKLRKN